MTNEPRTIAANPDDSPVNEPVPAPTDPGGAHAKGYSADPAPETAVPEKDPVPLAAGPNRHPAVSVPERDNHVQATGRKEPGAYTPNDRLMGADR